MSTQRTTALLDKSYNIELEQVSMTGIHLTCICEDQGSNLSQRTWYSEVYFGSSPSFQMNLRIVPSNRPEHFKIICLYITNLYS
jgi:hypothetical protein